MEYDTDYINRIFSQNNMQAIDDFIITCGTAPLEYWKSQNNAIADRWANSPNDGASGLLAAIGEARDAFKLKGEWQAELRRRSRAQKQERPSAPHTGDAVSGNKYVNFFWGDYNNVQQGGSHNSMSNATGAENLIRDALKKGGVSENQIACIEPEIAEISAECKKETVNESRFQSALLKIKEKLGAFAYGILTQTLSAFIMGKISGQ